MARHLDRCLTCRSCESNCPSGVEYGRLLDLCCGSAGSYSLLKPEISLQLREHKPSALVAEDPTVIATANIGCLDHLNGGTDTPVVHWIELLNSVNSEQ